MRKTTGESRIAGPLTFSVSACVSLAHRGGVERERERESENNKEQELDRGDGGRLEEKYSELQATVGFASFSRFNILFYVCIIYG